MDEAMDRARKALHGGRRVDAVVMALQAVHEHVKPGPARLRMMARDGYSSVFGGAPAVAIWMASLPRPGTLGL
ncbi:MAG TPA: hypothetical protein VGC15_20420 [Acetobacteraceae bacterium]